MAAALRLPPLKTVAIAGVRGIDNKAPPERLRTVPARDAPLIDLVEAQNVDIDNTGRIARRAGQTLKVAGSTHSLWSNGQVCLYVKDGTMYRLDEGFASTAIAAGLTDDPVAYVEVDGRIYHSNGRTTAVVDAGRVRSWGLRLTDIDVAASVTTGAMEAGVYLFAMTLLRADGQESGTGLAQRIDLGANAGIAFSWSVPADPGIVGVALYVSQPNGEVLYQAATVDAEAGQYTYAGGARSLELATQWLDAPPAGQVLALYRGRIYIAAGDVLYATAPLGYEYCDLRDFRAIDGSAIRLLAAMEEGLLIGTARGVWFLQGNDFRDSTVSLVMAASCVTGTLDLVDGRVVTGRDELAGKVVALFATDQGVLMGLPDGTLTNLTQEHYAMTPASRGAALLRDGAATQYLLCMQG